ncbi:histidinol-phosphatase HisJ family protein [Allobaculum stercoricanis]|uniref:histidinol-phosphatase HisJ family protein n=1 Tax=Allobaculum stercoricanis TaxID=174709 RepID=UPI002942F9E9|nr:histidinol-phosphatase HisJ family protein [Allobaculum stercoricanis]
MIKQNLHTHSQYDDGKDAIDEIVQKAQERGFTILGFSGHGYYAKDDSSMTPEKTKQYIQDVRQAQQQAPNGLKIYLGIEKDSMAPIENVEDFDYVIGSVHYLEHNGKIYPIDYSQEQFDEMLKEGYQNDINVLAKDYYLAIERQAQNPNIQIIGHLDLIAKYNEDQTYYCFDDPKILSYAKVAIEQLVKAGKIFEMNSGAMARGYRNSPYPSIELLKLIYEANGKILINTDCHDKEYLDYGMQICLDLAKQIGFKTLEMFNGKNFESKNIEEFFV